MRSETDGDRSTGAREGSGQPARGAARRARRAGASEAIFDGDRRRNANGGGVGIGRLCRLLRVHYA